MHANQAKKLLKANIRNRLVSDNAVLDEVTDPVKNYLREMGGVALLCREDETKIAKEIEAGEQEVRHALLKTKTGVYGNSQEDQTDKSKSFKKIKTPDA
jgi:hypothetical protein